MLQLRRELPLIGIQGGPHLVSCSESSIIKLYQALYIKRYIKLELSSVRGKSKSGTDNKDTFRVQEGANFRLPRGELLPFPVQSRVK